MARPPSPAKSPKKPPGKTPDAADATEPSARAEYPPAHYWRRWSADALQAAPAASDQAVSPTDDGTKSGSAAADDPADAPYRVLIVEDDRSQALFAESVLTGAGLQARVVGEAGAVMAAMEEFRPDLVLMDLHLPEMSGTELTAMIRGHQAFAHTPIVFLTGDPDPERQFEVLESGADDFLNKPIRPRHLIAAVQSRVKRAREMQRQRFGDATRHPLTGLYNRPYLMQRITSALGAAAGGGALFVEVQGAGALQDRYGYASFEQLMTHVGQRIGQLAGALPAARLNDNAFLVFATDGHDPQLEGLARHLRDGIGHPPFDMEGMPQRLRVAVGFTALAHGFASAGGVVDAAEQAARAARTLPIGLCAYQPPVAAHENADLIGTIRSALQDERFELAFQPIVAVAGGDEAQFQVLLRMRDEAGEVHSAGGIVPAAEASGLMPDIDRWVLEQAVALLHRRVGEQRPVRLFVSQSPHTLARDLHGEWLRETLDAHGIPGPSLVIDLRLDDALVHSVTLRQFCDLLMPVGVQFCLSQYTHGGEADALLSQLPLGYVRLSPRYSHANADPQLRDELRTVIDRAHRLGLQVIGQQVEDPQGAATLWMSGIDYIQGNLVQEAAGGLEFDFQNSVL